jgi:hypothetical protein
VTLLACARAQVAAEVRMRLRAPGTVFAVLGILALSFLWLPDPGSNAVAISWSTRAGQRLTGLYTSAFVGTASAALAGLFLSLIGFYLVAGSVRRDRESGVGAILAATPLTKTAYLSGKLAALTVYLMTVGLAALASGILVFVRYGSGPFVFWQFLAPFLTFVTPALTFTAALALLFDATPGLRGRGGLVAYFFVWSFGLIAMPAQLHDGADRPALAAVFDPTGIAALLAQIDAQSDVKPGSVSIGVEITDTHLPQVPWRIAYLRPGFVALRLLSLCWAIVPLAASVALFDRFDPARRRARVPRRDRAPFALAASNEPAAARTVRLSRIEASPSAWGAILAEARLVWLSASWLRWPLAASALAAGLLPGAATRGALAAFLLLLAPILAEVAAREALSGTRGLVQAQAGVPASLVLWKAGAVLVFVLAFGSLALLRTAAEDLQRALALAGGLVFVAALSVACGVVTGGGKLFTGVYTTQWYLAINGAGFLDFSGAFGGGLGLGARTAYLAAAAAALLIAWAIEAWRTRPTPVGA